MQNAKGFTAHDATIATIIGNCGAIVGGFVTGKLDKIVRSVPASGLFDLYRRLRFTIHWKKVNDHHLLPLDRRLYSSLACTQQLRRSCCWCLLRTDRRSRRLGVSGPLPDGGSHV